MVSTSTVSMAFTMSRGDGTVFSENESFENVIIITLQNVKCIFLLCLFNIFEFLSYSKINHLNSINYRNFIEFLDIVQ